MIVLHLELYSVVFFSFAVLFVLFIVGSAAYRDGVDDTKKKLLSKASQVQAPPRPADRANTLPTPDGLDAELMAYVVPGHRIELRLVCCKVKDCGAILLTPREYSPESMTETQYATEQGWHKAAVPPDRSVYWFCSNHMKAVRELLTLEEA